MAEKSVRLMSIDERKKWEDEQARLILEEDFKKDKTFKLGLIQESGYLCVGDSYQDAGKAFDDSDRVKGLNFKVMHTKNGKVGKNIYFGSLNPTCLGDPYKTQQERIF